MARKKKDVKASKVGIKLSETQRKLLLGEPIHIHEKLAEALRTAPTNAPILLTLDDWDDLPGHVAAESNHTTNKTLRKKLDAIFARIQDGLETSTDEEPPKPRKIQDAQQEKELAEQTAQLVEWTATMLIGAEQLGIKTKPIAKFPLPEAERAVLMMTPTIDAKLQKKLAAKSPKLTVGDVGELLMAVAEAMLDAPPLQGFALIMTAKGLMDRLEFEVTGAMEPKAKGSTSATIYRFRITLADIDPPIWRQVEVFDCSLGELHEVIQLAMGWQNSHMHQFLLGGKSYGQATSDDLDLEVEDEDKLRLCQIFTGKKKPRIIYEYDFGDSWQYEIRLEETLEPEPKVKYLRRCLFSHGLPGERRHVSAGREGGALGW